MNLSAAAQTLLLHPRVVQQQVDEEAARRVLEIALPRVTPFREREVHSLVAALDWDHRLPSKTLTLRLHLCYEEATRQRLELALARRNAEIAERDLFPEFDVPDYGGLPADEAYDIDLSNELSIEAMRLTSPWRREVAEEDGGRAVELVRASRQFADAKNNEPERPANLGDLEAVAWTPPCESNQPRWTLDVWWLTSFDGRIGKGWSFLVDTAASEPVVAAREFTIRAG
ncbi:MAG TPA: hypothetical protein VII38_02945 [Polyangia bacterium]